MIEVRLDRVDLEEAMNSEEKEFVVEVAEAVPLSEVVELCVALKNAIAKYDELEEAIDISHITMVERGALAEERKLLSSWIDVPETCDAN